MSSEELKVYIAELIKAKQTIILQREFFEAVFKEISYYMTLTEVGGEESIAILVRLFQEFKIHKKLIL